MDYEELRALAQHQRVNFVRDIKSEITALDDGRILVLTRLLDEWHDISTIMMVDQDLVISEFETKMNRIPHYVCPEAIAAYSQIKGLMVFQRGILKEIRGRVERTAGCTHITELIEAGLRALFAGLYNVRREVDLRGVLDKEDIRQLNILRPVLQDTCRSFRKADSDPEQVHIALEKVRSAGHDPEKLDPHRSTV